MDRMDRSPMDDEDGSSDFEPSRVFSLEPDLPNSNLEQHNTAPMLSLHGPVFVHPSVLGTSRAHSTFPPAKVKRTIRVARDLTDLMIRECHVNSTEVTPDITSLRCAVLFKVMKIDRSESSVEVKFLPLSYAGSPLPASDRTMEAPLDVLPSTKEFIDLASKRRLRTTSATTPLNDTDAGGSGKAVTAVGVADSTSQYHWPSNELPVELFEMICQHLSPRDVRSMRLASREFCSKVSPTLFKDVVVPFTSELYDMIEDDVSVRLGNLSIGQTDHSKDKSKSNSVRDKSSQQYLNQTYEDGSFYLRSEEDAHRHGLRVFQGFGPHMSKFGIRFDVTEADLVLAPTKQTCRPVQSYHGVYDWPPPGYPRFGKLAQIEHAADETPRMTAAFSCLKNVREIGLSVDSGLGYLEGPDRSIHAMIFDKPSRMFYRDDERWNQDAPDSERFFQALCESYHSFTGDLTFSEERLLALALASPDNGTAPLSFPGYEDTSLWPSCKVSGLFGTNVEESAMGVFYTTHEPYNRIESFRRTGVAPGHLTSQQKQWLLETGWAQSAFMDTYILALADNPQVFHQVKTITIAKMSSGMLQKLDHTSFWDALPNIEDVFLLVSPEWRVVEKDEAGDPDALDTAPSKAVTLFHAVVRRMSLIENIKSLTIGYTDGGEHGHGVLGRNAHLMPAPIATLDQLLTPTPKLLRLEHVKNLCLVNCWITPNALMGLATSLTGDTITREYMSLRTVSLTAHVGPESLIKIQNDPGQGISSPEVREGCWAGLIDRFKTLLSPTENEEFENQPNPFHPRNSEQTIHFSSCGYTILPENPNLNQDSIFPPAQPQHLVVFQPFIPPNPVPQAFGIARGQETQTWFSRRAELLRSKMQVSDDRLLGRIAAWDWAHGCEASMISAWGFAQMRKNDDWWSEGPVFDGKPKVGTGRFWGTLKTPEPEPEPEPEQADDESSGLLELD